MTAQLVQAPFSRHASSLQILTDWTVMLFPLLLAVALGMELPRRLQLEKFLLILIVAAIIATFFAWQTAGAFERFEAPSALAIVGAWTLAAAPWRVQQTPPWIRRWARLAATLVVIGLVPAIVGSGSRTALVMWALAGMTTLVLPGLGRTPRWRVLLAGGLLAGAAALMTDLTADLRQVQPLSGMVQQARLQPVLSGELDQSTKERIYEARDTITTMHEEAFYLDYIAGLGHGATYVPRTAHILANVDDETGRVHSVHVTPVMVWFRYGIVGIVCLATLLAFVVAGAVAQFRRFRDFSSVFLLTAAIVYLGDLWARNSFVDVGFAITIACIAVYRRAVDVEEG